MSDVPNLTIPIGVYRQEVEYVTYKAHAIGPTDIFFVLLGYAVLVYFWVKANKNREYYEKWTNPRGRVVNLYKIIKILMIVYPIIILIMGGLQIYLTLMMA